MHASSFALFVSHYAFMEHTQNVLSASQPIPPAGPGTPLIVVGWPSLQLVANINYRVTMLKLSKPQEAPPTRTLGMKTR